MRHAITMRVTGDRDGDTVGDRTMDVSTAPPAGRGRK
jgi:hypothetical protein